ncbi:MAG: hypothetical protein MUO76_18145, partial [Anaerolineaceae bacterium]|nr:hypothetical protein [Anaerolineaceae bacterium]
ALKVVRDSSVAALHQNDSFVIFECCCIGAHPTDCVFYEFLFGRFLYLPFPADMEICPAGLFFDILC